MKSDNNLNRKGLLWTKNLSTCPVAYWANVYGGGGKTQNFQKGAFVRCFLNSLLCDFRENYSTHHALLRFIESCRRALDSGNTAEAVLMDLSKAVDCLNYDLLLAKLEAYGFSKGALQLILSYLNGRKQRVKVNGFFSTWIVTSAGVPQGSVVGPLLFNIYLSGLFMFVTDCKICNYADDTTIYVCNGNHENVINKLESETLILSEWFKSNYMKLNGDKCHLMIWPKASRSFAYFLFTWHWKTQAYHAGFYPIPV